MDREKIREKRSRSGLEIEDQKEMGEKLMRKVKRDKE